MNDGTEDQVKVSFPASPVFGRIGRVAVAGLALRLGVEIGDVEKLRLAVDHAVASLSGSGRITLKLHWQPHQLMVTIDNPDAHLDAATARTVAGELEAMVDEAHVRPDTIDLTIGSASASNGASP